MCGISGIIDNNNRSNREILVKMTDALSYRGPDDSGYFFERFVKVDIGLGHRRLSILDLSSQGHQPMSFEHLSMIYNGEVYNFKEIRAELEKLGYGFDSNSDTEVILKAYHCWGIDAVNRFNGMFAIAIFDKQRQELVLIRDRAGVKPLYWYHKDGLFLFASELKSFHRHPHFEKQINHDALAIFLRFGYIPQPHTIFRSTHKLPGGHFLRLNVTTQDFTINKYWDVIQCYNRPKLQLSVEEALSETERLLKSACNYRMVSDVPVGVFLSGGYDSSAVTALLQAQSTEKIKTLTIGFHEAKFNEAEYAKKVAQHLGTDHTEYYCSARDALDIIPKLPEIWDEPFADLSTIPTLLVSKLAKSTVGVSLSADGGDELFGGYTKYPYSIRLSRIKRSIPFAGLIGSALLRIDPEKLPLLNRIPKFDRRYRKILHSLSSANVTEILSSLSNVYTPTELRKLLHVPHSPVATGFDSDSKLRSDLGELDKLMAVDYQTYQVDDILTKVDRATMAVSLEGREPLLDFNLIEFVSRLGPELKIRNGSKKFLLKEIVHKYLPKELMDRPKMGFEIPMFDWFKEELRDYLLNYLDEKRIEQAEIFNTARVVELRDRYLRGFDVNLQQLWHILVFEMWRERWMG